MKNFFFVLLILWYQQLLVAQCTKKWEVGSAIGACSFTPIPTTSSLAATGGAEINFSVRFDDADISKATPGSICTMSSSGNIEPNNASYNILWTISDVNYASFDDVTSNIGSKTVSAAKIGTGIPFSCGRTGSIWASTNAPIFIKSSFASTTIITITAKITDNTALPAGDIGSLVDAPKEYTWTIRFDTRPCPTSVSLNNSSQNNVWIDAITPAYVQYSYKCLPTVSPNYQGKLISESFGLISAASFFTMADVDRTYLPTPIITADGVANYLFSRFLGQPNTFTVNSGDSFIDQHAIIHPDAYQTGFYILGASGLTNNKLGFSIPQTYKCNGSVIANAILYKRGVYNIISNDYTSQIKKSH